MPILTVSKCSFFLFKVKEWLRLIPFFASLGLVGYVTYKEINDFLHRKELQWINKDICKEKNKIADIISRSEINEALDKSEKVAYCRCWKSKRVRIFNNYITCSNTQIITLAFQVSILRWCTW